MFDEQVNVLLFSIVVRFVSGLRACCDIAATTSSKGTKQMTKKQVDPCYFSFPPSFGVLLPRSLTPNLSLVPTERRSSRRSKNHTNQVTPSVAAHVQIIAIIPFLKRGASVAG
jgi:hypothetical protein